MPWLDCHDVRSALETVASCLKVEPTPLLRVVIAYDESRFGDHSIDPGERMPGEVAASLGVDLAAVHVDGAFYFHGTRLCKPDAVRADGLQPLMVVEERIWSHLYDLVSEAVSQPAWETFRDRLRTSEIGGDGGWQYRYKAVKLREQSGGPFAVLVRDTFLAPPPSHVDFLACPEIVEDIALSFEHEHGIDLRSRFVAATFPCIVKFQSTSTHDGLLPAALWYLFDAFRDGRVSSRTETGWRPQTGAVAAADIVDVEVLGPRGSWNDQHAAPQFVPPRQEDYDG